MLSSKEIWNISTSGATGNGTRTVTGGSNSYAFMPSGMPMQGGSTALMPAVAAPVHDRSQEICKYYVNGGCLRGAACPYLHELPDERHLDVNGVGFILNPNVHNAQKTVSVPQAGGISANPAAQGSPTTTGSPLTMGLNGQSGTTSRQFQFNKAAGKAHYSVLSPPASAMPLSSSKSPAKYRPPEPYLEHNLTPVLALPLRSTTKEVAQSLTRSLLQN